MIMRRMVCILHLIVLLFLSSCGGGKLKLVSIGEPEFIKEFPFEGQLAAVDSISIDEIGCNSIKFIDSLMIIGHAKTWSVYSNDGKRKYGDVLSIGQGPNEFYSIPRCAASAFVTESDSIIAYIPAKELGIINRFNLSRFVNDGEESVSEHLKSAFLSNEVWDVIPCDSSASLLSLPIHNFTGFNRSILSDGKLNALPVTASIDSVTVGKEEDINLLSRVTRYNKVADKFVEGMLFLNQINIFNRDGSWGKTVCVGPVIDNLAEVEDQYRFNRKNAYTTMAAWDFGFAGAYSGITEKERQLGLGHPSELFFFDWDGNPVGRVHLKHSVNAFDIDLKNQLLYILTEEDDFKVYDVSILLKQYELM